MPQSELEQILVNLPTLGDLIEDGPRRQRWRFDYQGKVYHLHYYPRGSLRRKLARLFRGNPAWREFRQLQWLQKAGVAAPRAVAYLSGFRLSGQIGDAVILEALDRAEPLDRFLSSCDLASARVPARRQIVAQLCTILQQLGRARLDCAGLGLGSFVLHNDKLYLNDTRAVRRGAMSVRDVLRLGQDAAPFATRTDMLRVWRSLRAGASPPRASAFTGSLAGVFGEGGGFGRLTAGRWKGYFFRHTDLPRRWSLASHRRIGPADWQAAWPELLRQIENDQLTVIKRCTSGDVLAGDVVLGGRPLSVVVKRPRRKHWWRYINEIGRGSRARRAWRKAWGLVYRNVPTAWPLMMMEKRTAGYVTDGVIVFEHVPGNTLAATALGSMSVGQRSSLLFRVGRILRQIERSGLFYYDSKATNWMVLEDEKQGPLPLVVDVDGLRPWRVAGGGLARLLRSLREHPDFTATDEQAVRQGYDPFARQAPRQPAAAKGAAS